MDYNSILRILERYPIAYVEKKFSTCSIHHHLNEICIDYKVIKINHVEM